MTKYNKEKNILLEKIKQCEKEKNQVEQNFNDFKRNQQPLTQKLEEKCKHSDNLLQQCTYDKDQLNVQLKECQNKLQDYILEKTKLMNQLQNCEQLLAKSECNQMDLSGDDDDNEQLKLKIEAQTTEIDKLKSEFYEIEKEKKLQKEEIYAFLQSLAQWFGESIQIKSINFPEIFNWIHNKIEQQIQSIKTDLQQENEKLISKIKELENDKKLQEEKILTMQTNFDKQMSKYYEDLKEKMAVSKENKILKYLQADNIFSEDDAISNWQHNKDLLKNVYEQLKQIANTFKLVDLPLQNFGQIIADYMNNQLSKINLDHEKEFEKYKILQEQTLLDMRNSANEEIKKHYKNLYEENKIIKFLQSEYGNNFSEDVVISDWQYNKSLVQNVHEQLKQIENELELVQLKPQNFGEIITDNIKSISNCKGQLNKIATAASINNNDKLVPIITDIITKYYKYQKDIKQLECGINLDNVYEKLKLLKDVSLWYQPISSDDWYEDFLKFLDQSDMKQYFNTFKESRNYIKLLYDHVLQYHSNLKGESNWLEGFIYLNEMQIKKFNSLQNIIIELEKLTADVHYDNKHDWKNVFIERYNFLWNFALKFTDPADHVTYEALKNSLNSFLTKVEEVITYIHLVSETGSVSSRLNTILSFIVDLHKKDSLASSLNFNDWVTQMLNSEKYKNKPDKKVNLKEQKISKFSYKSNLINVTHKKIHKKLEKYFNIKRISLEDVVSQIDTYFKDLFKDFIVSPPNFPLSEYSTTFEEHLTTYTTLISKKQLDKFLLLYEEWLSILKLDSTLPIDEFSNKLKQCFDRVECNRMNRKRRNIEQIPKSDKMFLLDKNYSSIEIQNIIYMLYKAYFKLKLDILTNHVPNLNFFKKIINKKLKILDALDKNQRESNLLNMYEQYIEYDLETIIGRITKPFMDVENPNEVLEKSMRHTETYLERLSQRMNEEMIIDSTTKSDDDMDDNDILDEKVTLKKIIPDNEIFMEGATSN